MFHKWFSNATGRVWTIADSVFLDLETKDQAQNLYNRHQQFQKIFCKLAHSWIQETAGRALLQRHFLSFLKRPMFWKCNKGDKPRWAKPPWVKFKDYLEGKGPFEKPSGLQTITEKHQQQFGRTCKSSMVGAQRPLCTLPRGWCWTWSKIWTIGLGLCSCLSQT